MAYGIRDQADIDAAPPLPPGQVGLWPPEAEYPYPLYVAEMFFTDTQLDAQIEAHSGVPYASLRQPGDSWMTAPFHEKTLCPICPVPPDVADGRAMARNCEPYRNAFAVFYRRQTNPPAYRTQEGPANDVDDASAAVDEASAPSPDRRSRRRISG